jgi:hypothetical protein
MVTAILHTTVVIVFGLPPLVVVACCAGPSRRVWSWSPWGWSESGDSLGSQLPAVNNVARLIGVLKRGKFHERGT